jgi:hypothetical protein
MQLSSEDFEQHVVDTLTTLLPAKLDQVEAHYLDKDRAQGLADPDGTSWVILAPPAAIWPGGTDVRTGWPGIEVAVPDLSYEGFSIGQTDAAAEVSLVVMVWVKDPRFPVLERMSKRYTAAVFDCLAGDNALGDASIDRVRFAWRTNPELRDQDERIEAGGLIVLTLNTGMIRA